jgi:hypothetical protein
MTGSISRPSARSSVRRIGADAAASYHDTTAVQLKLNMRRAGALFGFLAAPAHQFHAACQQ